MATKGEDSAKKLIKDGWIHVLTTFEVIGKPEDHVNATIKQLVDGIEKEKRFHFIERHVEPAVETEDGFFSTFAEVDMLVKNIETLTWLAANATPATIEIIEPLSFEFTAGDIQAWYSDVLSTLHTIGYTHKTQNGELHQLRTQIHALVENALLLSLARGKKTLPHLVIDTKIEKPAVEAYLEALVKAKHVKVAKGVYSLK